MGVGLASFFAVEIFWLGFFPALLIILALVFWRRRFLRYLFFGGVILVLGVWRYQLSLPQAGPQNIWFYNGQKAQFEGIIGVEPDIRINKAKLTVSVKRLTVDRLPLTAEGKVLINADLYPEYEYGDRLSIVCQLKAPEPFNGFAYDRYLAKDDIYSVCSFPKIQLLGKNNGDWLLAKIFIFKNKLWSIVKANLPEPEASLFFGINFGSRGGIPQELSDKFSATGTSHLVAISGMNITIIAAVLMNLFLACYIPRKKAFWLITAVLIIYSAMIGFPPSAVRSAIMGWLVILAIYVGRRDNFINALIFSAGLMIVLNPKILRDDVGFQLSFLAVLGLIYLAPFFEKALAKVTSFLGIKESLQMTLAAQLSTLPIIIFNFGRLSLIAPVANLFAVPVMIYLMIAGFLALFFSLLLPPLAPYFFWPLWLIMSYLVKVIEIFAIIPYAALSL